MLRELRIENLALIESLHLSFEEQAGSNLVVMTGETGAGKSIMLRAIHLLTGGRASVDWIRNDSESCVVEALFEIDPEHKILLNRLTASGYGGDTNVLIKRILTRKGRSRLYVNGSLATAKIVSDLTDNMLNIASQHDHQQLLQPALHLDFLDTLGELWMKRQALAGTFGDWQEKKKRLALLKQQEREKEQRKDFFQYQVKEIQDAELHIGEDEALAIEKNRLKSSDTLIKLSQQSYKLLSSSILDDLVQVRRNLEQVVVLDPQVAKLAEEVTEYSFRAEDVAQLVREYRDSLESDPYRLDQVNERLDFLQSLKRKYGESLEDVLTYLEEAEVELARLDKLEIQLQDLDAEVILLEEKLTSLATELSKARQETAKVFERNVTDELHSLSFTAPKFEVGWKEVSRDIGNLLASGWDRVEYFFSANPGEPLKPLTKVASGGELSRLMLALKCILAKKDMVDTVIFDEVDAGIGGEAAEAVARKIKELAGHHQVFCITHLPQIASRGGDHYCVSKSVFNSRTQSQVSRLTKRERIEELARMLAGDSVSAQTVAWAEELLMKGGAKT